MQDVGDPLRRRQRLQDHKQREPHGIGEYRVLLRVGCGHINHPRLRPEGIQRLLAP
jgi:hypothetical protein